MRDQELSNALMDTNWVKAVKLAFTLQRPLKLFSVFTDLLRFTALPFPMLYLACPSCLVELCRIIEGQFFLV